MLETKEYVPDITKNLLLGDRLSRLSSIKSMWKLTK